MVWLTPSAKSGPKIPDIAAVSASKLAYFGIFRLSRKSRHFLQILGVKSLILGHADPGTYTLERTPNLISQSAVIEIKSRAISIRVRLSL